MSVQNVPGTLALTNELASGIGAEAIAVAMTSVATNQLSDNMTSYAQDQYVEGQKMAPLMTAMQYVQLGLIIATPVLGGLGLGLLAVNSESMAGQMATSLVKAATEGVQGASGLAMGGIQARKSTLQASIELDTTGANVDEKLAGSNGNTITSLSQGESKLGSDIATIAQSMGSVMSNKFAR